MRKFSLEKVLKATLIISFLILSGQTSGFGQKADQQSQEKISLQKCWTIEANNLSEIASDNDSIFLTDFDGNLKQLNLSDHLRQWNNFIGHKIDIKPYIFGEKVILIGSLQDDEKMNIEDMNISDRSKHISLREIDKNTGITKWITNIRIDGKYRLFFFGNSQSLIIVSEKLQIFSVNIETGKINWSFNNDRKEPLATESTITEKFETYIQTADNQIANIKISDSISIKFLEFKQTDFSVIEEFDNSIYFGDSFGNVYRTDLKLNSQSKILKAGGKITFITRIGKEILITANDNFIYLYSIADKKIKWKKRLPGRVVLSPLLHRDKILLTTITDPDIFLFEISDGKLSMSKSLYDRSVIRNVLTNSRDILVLTNLGLNRLSPDCS